MPMPDLVGDDDDRVRYVAAPPRRPSVASRSISSSVRSANIRFDTHSVRQSRMVNVPAARCERSGDVERLLDRRPPPRLIAPLVLVPRDPCRHLLVATRFVVGGGAVAMNVTASALRRPSSNAKVLLPLRAPPVRNVRWPMARSVVDAAHRPDALLVRVLDLDASR